MSLNDLDAILEEQDAQLRHSNLSAEVDDFRGDPHCRDYHGTLTGRDYETREAMEAAENREAMIRSAQRENPLDNLEPEQIARLFERATQTDRERAIELRQEEAAKLFRAAHPEYRATPRNGQMFDLLARERGVQPTDVAGIEKLYADLCDEGLLEIDHTVLEAQRQEELNERGRQMRASGLRNTSRTGIPRYSETPEQERERLYAQPDSEFFRSERDNW